MKLKYRRLFRPGSMNRSKGRTGRSRENRSRSPEAKIARERMRSTSREASSSPSRSKTQRCSRSGSCGSKGERGRPRDWSSSADSGDGSMATNQRKPERRHGRKQRRSNGRHRDRSRDTNPEQWRRERKRQRLNSESERKMKEKEEKKKMKERLKALETPEEKRARRLAKKEEKDKKRREKNLLGVFKWQKALEQKGIGHLGEKDLKERKKHIQEENRRELKVKQQRLEREREKVTRETEQEMLQREREAEHFQMWEEQEHNFHLQQAKLRSTIRIREGRAKPIDRLIKYINAEDNDLAVEMHVPYTFLNGLTIADMDDLLEDIKVWLELDRRNNANFWNDMTTFTEHEIRKVRKREAFGIGPDETLFLGNRHDGINKEVSANVQDMFKGKTYSALHALHLNIEAKIQAGGSHLDMNYWESLNQELRVYMARARLREQHQDILRHKLFKLKQEQQVKSKPLFPFVKDDSRDQVHTPEDQANSPSTTQRGDEETTYGTEGQPSLSTEGGGGEKDEVMEVVLTEEDLIQQSQAEYNSGCYSPTLLTSSELPPPTHTISPGEDADMLPLAEIAEDAFIHQAREGMDKDEAQFSVEIPVTDKPYLWADKYRPRKPRFFNRIYTGVEWNTSNQKDYDFDNPPPKTVQGYKFNIFYPDLISKHPTPQCFLEASSDDEDFAVLRFQAGPPYKDIAFKIVNNEWEYSKQHGFRCKFANGILQVWFQFKGHHNRR